MSAQQSMMDVPLEWFTVEEAARYLRVSRRTIYAWSANGKLPAYLIGDRRHRRYRKYDLDNVPRRIEDIHITGGRGD